MSNDFTSTLVLNLQQRVAYMENALGFLTTEVQRLSQANGHVTQGFQTAIPLQPAPPAQTRRIFAPRQQVSRSNQPQDENPTPISLSEILNPDEAVTFGIHTGRDASGSVSTSFLTAIFDSTNLTVTECATVPSLINTQSSKPGEILFKFMHGLVDAGHLQRTFNALPWRLATVTRNGQKITLAQLRREKQDAQ